MVERAVAPKLPVDLLNRILESPGLVKMVQDLPPPVLTRMVRHIGLEDAAEIVAMATVDQLNRVFDEDLWLGVLPGEEEVFNAERFILWLKILFESGLESAMEKIVRLDEDLITLALSRHILVLDMETLAVGMARCDRGDDADLVDKRLDGSLSLELEGYLVIARTHHGWEAISTLLVELNQADDAMLNRLLRHCARPSTEYIEDNGGLYDVLTSEEMLAADLYGERQERRQKDGYVLPTSAAAFLELARHRTLVQHMAEKQWDYDTRRYFKALNADGAEKASADTVVPDPLASAERQRFRELLQEAEIISPPGTQKQLIFDGSYPEHMALSRAMHALREEEAVSYGRRLAEITYLANVLMAGCPLHGRRFRPVEAAEAAMATCQLGAEYLTGLSLADADDGDLANLTELLADTDMVRLFNCGWRILHERVGIPTARCLAEVMRRVKDTLHSTRRRRDLAEKLLSLDKKIKASQPWLFVQEIDDLLGELDNDVLAQLSDLLSEYPVLPSALQRPEDNARLPVIHTYKQVVTIEQYLIELNPSATTS
jgi:hypothetical protein